MIKRSNNTYQKNSSNRKSIVKAFMLVLVILFAIPKQQLQASEYNENQIKLAFILKMMDFIDDLPQKEDKHVMCFYGFIEEEFNELKTNINDMKSANLTLVKKNNIDTSRSCRIAFINNNYTEYKKLLDYIENHSILTFAEIQYFIDNGGMVEFYKYNDKFRFRINNKLALSKGIRFNAKLLELSK